MEDKYCEVCGSTQGIELHHVIFRSQCKPLENCKLNHRYLCGRDHRGTEGVHGKNGHELDQKLKLSFQNTLEMSFIKDSSSMEEIQEILGIKYNATKSLCKLMKMDNGKYTRESIILACMGGKLVQGDE